MIPKCDLGLKKCTGNRSNYKKRVRQDKVEQSEKETVEKRQMYVSDKHHIRTDLDIR